jgi:hypothetical protein
MKVILSVVIAAFLFAGCSGNADSEHTTATTIVPPPPLQTLRAELRPGPQEAAKLDFDPTDKTYDPQKPLLLVSIPQTTIREGEEVVVNFRLSNAKLKGDGGEFRIRYMVDDGDMQWIDRWEQLALSGWIQGKHILRVELIGPDGWPYRNGQYYNTLIHQITVEKP